MSNYYAQNGIRLASKFKDLSQGQTMTNSLIPHVNAEFNFKQ